MKYKDNLVAQYLTRKLVDTKVGILVKGVSNLSPIEICEYIVDSTTETFYVAIIGYDEVHPSNNARLHLSEKIETAVQWRSEPEKAGNILVFVKEDSDKLHSLAELDAVSSSNISEYAIDLHIQQESNKPVIKFWETIKEVARYFTFDMLEDFILSVNENQGDLIPTNLWQLNRLNDKEILNTNIDIKERLYQNRELILTMGQLSEASRRSIASSLRHSKGEKKVYLQSAYKLLQDYFKFGNKETLSKLTYQDLKALLSTTVNPKKEDNGKNDPNKEKEKNKEQPIQPKELNQLISSILIEPDEINTKAISDLYEDIKKYYEEESEGDTEIAPVGGDFENRKIIIASPNSYLRKIVGQACNNKVWGGVLQTNESILRDAVSTDIEHFHPFYPDDSANEIISFNDSSLFEFIDRFDQQFLEKGNDDIELFRPVLEALIQARTNLIQHLDLIMYHPILSFGIDKHLRNELISYIEAWSGLLRLYCQNELVMHEISQKGSNFVARALLLLDVLYVKTPNEWKGILLPLHPLFLWRYYEIFKDFDSDREEMLDQDKKALEEVLNKLPQIMNFLVVDSMITNEKSLELPCSGTIDSLPTFENKTNRYLGEDGIEAIPEIISRWIQFAPYTKNEVRICTIDAPDLPSILRSLKQLIENGTCNRISYTVFLTRNQNGNSELAKLDYSDRDFLIGEYLKNGKLSINIKNSGSSKDIKNDLKQQPVHIAFYFDQASYTIEYGPSTKNLYISPLVITYDYEFDEITNRGDIFPSSDMDSGIIGSYHKVMRLADIISNNRIPRPTYNPSADISDVVSTIKDGETQWLVVADRSISNYSPEGTIPIGEHQYNRRNTCVWASSSSRIIDQYVTLLRQYNLQPDKEKLLSVIKQFGHISSEGLISIPRFGTDSKTIENRKKGLIGTVFSAAWFAQNYPNSLVASLDTPEARLWLYDSRYGDERADLIALSYDIQSDTLTFMPIEVKTRDDSFDAKIEKLEGSNQYAITGHAADQISSIVGMLSEIFGLHEPESLDMFIAARREVIKYQIVSECFRNMHDPTWQKEWSNLFKRAFSNNKSNGLKIKIEGLLIHVKLSDASGGKTIECFNPNADYCPIKYVELSAKEIQHDVIGGNMSPLLHWEHDVHEKAENEDDDQNEQDYNLDGKINDLVEDGIEDITEKGAIPATINSGNNKIDPNLTKDEYSHDKLEDEEISKENIDNLANAFKRSCQDYHIGLRECDSSKAVVGPSVIRLFFKLARGQSLQTLNSHLEDIGREMKRTGILTQIIKNSDELILDIPRIKRVPVLYKDIENMMQVESPEQLKFPLGRTPEGYDLIKDLSEMPHMLIGGSTGSGKTVFLFTLIASLIKTHPSPKDMQLVLSSSGLEDFIHFEGLPHLVEGRIISDAYDATELIKNTVYTEFKMREKILSEARVSNISQYNAKFPENKMAPLVVIIDEFADLADQLVKKKDKDDFYTPVLRIAQIGRKRGIHLVLCTQRPSATLVPSNIKAQLSGRVALRVNDANSSRMIIDESGAQQLQKHGDMIYKNGSDIARVQGYFISIEELDKIVTDVKKLNGVK